MEAISPELVLVDPELARAERARLEERARVASLLDISTLRRVAQAANPDPTPTQALRRFRAAVEFAQARGLPMLLVVSLVANGVLAGTRTTGAGRESIRAALSKPGQASTRKPSANVVMATSLTRTRAVTSSTAPPRATKTTATVAVTKSPVVPPTNPALERKLLTLVVESPRSRLPRALIDPRTGLAENNLQAVCRADAPASFLCVVRPSRHRPGEGLYVHYRRGVFSWSRYRGR